MISTIFSVSHQHGVSRLCSFLPLKSSAAVRLVSHTWSQQAAGPHFSTWNTSFHTAQLTFTQKSLLSPAATLQWSFCTFFTIWFNLCKNLSSGYLCCVWYQLSARKWSVSRKTHLWCWLGLLEIIGRGFQRRGCCLERLKVVNVAMRLLEVFCYNKDKMKKWWKNTAFTYKLRNLVFQPLWH